MRYHMTKQSTNVKTGPMPVATISKTSCPTSCPLRGNGGCYAEGGPLRIHWDAITNEKRGTEFPEFLEAVEDLPRRKIWRYGQAGDLPGVGDEIDAEQLVQLATANDSRPVIAFTHKPATAANMAALNAAADLGFRVNLSADNLEEADEFSDLGASVVVVLPLEYGRKSARDEWRETVSEYKARTASLPKITPNGRRIAVCPATYTDTNCKDCGVCANHNRNGAIVGFPAHGARKAKVARA